METKDFEKVYLYSCSWWWGSSIDVVRRDGTAKVCVKFDEKSFPNSGYICDLAVLPKERQKNLGWMMMQYAIYLCKERKMNFARLHVDIKNIWLREWYERLGFKELSRDENEIEMVMEL